MTGKPFKAKLRQLDVARMVAEEPPPVPWVVHDLVVNGMLTMLNGREGEKKSLLALALAAGVAEGHTQGGFLCRRGGVVVIDAENGEHEIHRRVHSLGIPEGVEVYNAEGFDLRNDLYDIERVIERHSPSLLILDSFRSLWGGRENESDEAAPALDPLRTLAHQSETGMLLLHHSNRGGSGEYRGSSAIGASVELGFTLARDPGDQDPHRSYVDCWKCRPATKPSRRWIRLAVEGGQVLIEPAEPRGDQPPVLTDLTPQVFGELGDSPKKRADVARGLGRDPKDRSVGRVLTALKKGGRVEQTDQGWVRVASGRALGGCHPATLGNGHDPDAELERLEMKWGEV